jgi:hypothetical protein
MTLEDRLGDDSTEEVFTPSGYLAGLKETARSVNLKPYHFIPLVGGTIWPFECIYRGTKAGLNEGFRSKATGKEVARFLAGAGVLKVYNWGVMPVVLGIPSAAYVLSEYCF